MFSDRDIAYASSNDSLSYSEPDLSPASTLFSLGSPWDLSTSTSGRGSISSMEPDDMSFGISSYSNPAGIQDEFFSMAEGMNDTIPVFMDQNLLFPSNYNKLLSDQSMLGYSTLTGYDEPAYDSFDIQSSIQNAQTSLDLDIYSQMSSIGSPSLSMNFVVPSQTTFAERYDLQTPLRELKQLPVSSSDSSNELNAIIYPPDDDDKFRMMPPRSCPAPRLRPSPTRKPAFESLQTSLDLQSASTDKYGMRHLRKQRARRGSNTVPTVPSHVRIQNKAIKKCEWPGCNGRFQRQEHLKRHEKTHINAETYICRFCNRPFGRSDNLKSHTRLHTKKTPRTQYFPEALEVYEEMSRKPRKARDSIPGGSKRASETGLSKPSLRSQASV